MSLSTDDDPCVLEQKLADEPVRYGFRRRADRAVDRSIAQAGRDGGKDGVDEVQPDAGIPNPERLQYRWQQRMWGTIDIATQTEPCVIPRN